MSHCHFTFAGKEWCTHNCSFITIKQKETQQKDDVNVVASTSKGIESEVVPLSFSNYSEVVQSENADKTNKLLNTNKLLAVVRSNAKLSEELLKLYKAVNNLKPKTIENNNRQKLMVSKVNEEVVLNNDTIYTSLDEDEDMNPLDEPS
ncbi:10749_t:CDS:2 [Funneliformis caledonium]|uniref:10749_t:CDS:1 n=1 Tax=Funneliformis caledonium TaxID=1117310 RepID=A0A9N9BDA8_9GLOM|nr:10749_t:CDS:2 [Funneliformis caledonium]